MSGTNIRWNECKKVLHTTEGPLCEPLGDLQIYTSSMTQYIIPRKAQEGEEASKAVDMYVTGIKYSCRRVRGSEEEWGVRTLRRGVAAGWQMQGYTGEAHDTG